MILFKSIVLLAVLFQIFHVNQVESACPSVLSCLNSGRFNNATCTCDCFLGYSGSYCEYNYCTVQEAECGQIYQPTNCKDAQLIRDFCPLMCNSTICKCGFNQCLNGGVFNASSCSCSCAAPYSGKICETVTQCSQQLQCLNGQFNNKTCLCDCYPNYYGNLCENLNCGQADPVDCSTYKPTDCALTIVSQYCPRFCGKCANQTNCTKLNCLNNGQFNNQTCKCDCYPNYNGALCENLDCSKPEPSTCSSFSSIHCSVEQVKNYCPILCGKCTGNSTTIATPTTQPGTSGQFTSQAVTTNQVTTQAGATETTQSGTTQAGTSGTTGIVTTISTCPILSCKYGNYNPLTCKCNCPLGFTGTLCENFDCVNNKTPDDPVCVDFSCTAPIDFETCPQKCFCSASQTTACTVLTCQNAGQFDSVSCKCVCNSNFYGTLCENINCVQDQAACSMLTLANCVDPNIKSICPFLCGLCSQATTQAAITSQPATTVQQTSAVTSGPVSTATTCTKLTCKYEIPFDPVTCSCNCPEGFYGPLCESYNCSTGIADPSDCAFFDCSAQVDFQTCPQLCFCTPQATPPPSTISTCQPLTCNYDLEFNPATCKCNCPAGFSGTLCENFDCVAGPLDDPVCALFDCVLPSDYSSCPRKCFGC